ncbi:MAG: ABC transporter permease subunit [Lentisphaeria bacterium]
MILFGNPILRRELQAHCRNRRSLVFALVLLGLLSAILLVLWPRSGIFSETSGNEIFSVFLGGNLLLMILMTPGFTSTCITSEREHGSFDVLFTSLLTPGEILTGKLAASLGMAFLLLLVSLPVTAVCALSGGISLPTLAKACTVIAAATLVYGLLGLAASAVCRRGYAALVTTYVGILLLAGATWLPAALLTQYPQLAPTLRSIRALSPFEALFALNYAERYTLAVGGAATADTVFQTYLAGMAGLGVLFFLVFSIFIFKPLRSRPPKQAEHFDDTKTAIRRKLGFPFYLIDPLRRRKPIRRGQNPVFVAEMRSKLFGNPKFIIRGLAVCMSVSLGLLILIANQYGTFLDADKLRVAAIIFQLGVLAFLAPAISSGSITDEISSGTLLLLRLTPLSATRVVLGKLKASFLYVLIFLVSSLPVLGALAYLESTAAYWRLAAWGAVLVLATVVLTAAGLTASSLCRNTAAATAASYLFACALCLAPLGVFLLGSRVSPEMQSWVLTLNPVAAALQITSDTAFAGLPALGGRKLWQNHLLAMSALTLLLVMVASWRVHRLFRQRD